MSTEIDNAVRALTAALAKENTANKDTRVLLHSLAHEITRLTEHHESVAERLEAMAIRFESDHPTVGTALRQAIDALSKAGI